MGSLSGIQDWYHSQCDGDWEHANGIRITTLDNPGWGVDIDLEGTGLDSKAFANITIEHSEVDWMHCFVENDVFKGRGGPGKLGDILDTFQDWISK